MKRNLALALLTVCLFSYAAMHFAQSPGRFVTENTKRTPASTAPDQHPTIKISDFVEQLKKSGQLQVFLPVVLGRIKAMVPEGSSGLQDQLSAALITIVNSGDINEYKKLDHFPVIPLKQVGLIRSAVGGSSLGHTSPLTSYDQFQGDLESAMNPCTLTAADPPPMSNDLPQLTYGHFNDPSLSPCQIHASLRLASIFNSLSARNKSATPNDSTVTYKGQTYNSARDVIAALVANGHQVTMMDERVYANFLSFNWHDDRTPGAFKDTEIIWPAWLATGVNLNPARARPEPLTIPMGHSQMVWQISGPEVNAKIMFFFGMYGTGFFADTELRPNWTGGRNVKTIVYSESPANQNMILDAFVTSAVYLQRVRLEAQNLPANVPFQGYGTLGVCNDSIALIEQKIGLQGIPIPFPLLRAASFDSAPDMGDGLDAIIKGLPKDGDQSPPNDALTRVFGMLPYDISNPADVDNIKSALGAPFSDMMFELQKEIGAN